MKKFLLIVFLLGIGVYNLFSQATLSVNAIQMLHGNGLVYYHAIVNANSRLIITIGNLPSGANVDFIVRNLAEFGGNIIFSSNDTVSQSGRITTLKGTNNFRGLDISNGLNNNTGIFEIEVREHNGSLSGNVIVNFAAQDLYLVIEKQEEYQLPGVPYKFLIHFADNFFQNHPLGTSPNTYLSFTKDALKESWQKEVTDWGLCNGINKTYSNGITINSMPIDSDGIYHVYIHCLFQLRNNRKGIEFYDGFDIYSVPFDGDRRIYIDSRLVDTLKATQNIQATPARLLEKELVYSVIHHEFYHGIQWSHVSWKSIAHQPAELSKRLWLIEGQAKFLETVFMKYYSTSSTNTPFVKSTNAFSYEYYCADLIKCALGQAYNYPKLHDVGYSYALFWRHLYEHNFSANTTDANRMALLRETAKLDTSSNLASINTFMSTALAAAGGTFTDFASGLKNFAERAYFHDTAYHNWDDPNRNDFYTAMSKYTEVLNLKNK